MHFTVLTFDLDGTLVETAEEIAEAINRTLADLQLPRQSVAGVAAHIGAGLRTTLDRVLAAQVPGAPAADATAYARLDAHYAAVAGRLSRCYEGAAQMLADLRVQGLRLAVVTNKEHRHAARVLQGVGLRDAVDYVIGGDSLPYKKPDAQVLHHVLRVLGGRPTRAAHLGDSHVDIAAAKNAGVAAWGVPWGYNGSRPIEAEAPDWVFTHLAEVAPFVAKANARGASEADPA